MPLGVVGCWKEWVNGAGPVIGETLLSRDTHGSMAQGCGGIWRVFWGGGGCGGGGRMAWGVVARGLRG